MVMGVVPGLVNWGIQVVRVLSKFLESFLLMGETSILHINLTFCVKVLIQPPVEQP